MKDTHFEGLEQAIREQGPQAAFDRLVETLRGERKLPQLFEALLMKKRHELGLPLQGNESLSQLPEELQQTVEDYYIETCRTVGSLFLEQGDIAGAWPYFRAIDEPQKVAKALEGWTPPENPDDPDDPGDVAVSDCDAIVDIAFNQGANPRRGYELILSEYGTCRAITTFEHQFPFPDDVKESCGEMLVRQLYQELLEGIRSDVEQREGKPPEESDVRTLINDRKSLFGEHGYHIDLSHLQAVVRAAANLKNPEVIDLAVQMCEYGRNLARDFQSSERPPFDDYYNDYRIFLRALLGEGVDGAVRYFTAKADRAGPDEDGNHFAGEVLVYLLHRVARYREAVEAYFKYLKDASGPLTVSPSIAELCELAGDFDSLLDLSRQKQDVLQFTAALVKRAEKEAEIETPD